MKNKSKLYFEFVVLVTSLFLISSGCVGSSPKVLVSSSYEASGLALLSNPVLILEVYRNIRRNIFSYFVLRFRLLFARKPITIDNIIRKLYILKN